MPTEMKLQHVICCCSVAIVGVVSCISATVAVEESVNPSGLRQTPLGMGCLFGLEWSWEGPKFEPELCLGGSLYNVHIKPKSWEPDRPYSELDQDHVN
ncbi:hypothetical protein V6N13_047337 [Hibiscus sabdariffa]|uniref:Uncharacterized protein n=1 Tax=Hibiscus sabdariffa TaxID=183260 RepID=A0ABR2F3V3_9ROSI